MVEPSERRQIARLTVPTHLGGFELELRLVRLLDLSSEGARIEHPAPLHEGLVCFVDLPPALGRVRLTGRIVWTRLHKGEQTFEGDKHLYYQSGLVFIGLTPEQQTALAAALEMLKTAQDTSEGDSLPADPGQGGGTPGVSRAGPGDEGAHAGDEERGPRNARTPLRSEGEPRSAPQSMKLDSRGRR